MADYSLWPFGRTVVPGPDAGAGPFVLHVIRFLLAGLRRAISRLVAVVLSCCTIIGVPLGLAHVKLILVCVTPLGKQIVRTDERNATAPVRRSDVIGPVGSSEPDRSAREVHPQPPGAGSPATTT